jgi:HEAT repeat protein
VPLDHPGRDRVSGRIWKITYKDNHREGTDWSKAELGTLIEGLGNEVLDIRMRATDELVDRIGKEAINPLKQLASGRDTPLEHLIQVFWALFRLDALDPGLLNNAIVHDELNVKVHALRILAEHVDLDQGQLNMALTALENEDPHVQRAGAELLGRHPGPTSLRPLMELHEEVPIY